MKISSICTTRNFQGSLLINGASQSASPKTFFEDTKRETKAFYDGAKSAIEQDKQNACAMISFFQRPEILEKVKNLPNGYIVNVNTTQENGSYSIYKQSSQQEKPYSLNIVSPNGINYICPWKLTNSQGKIDEENITQWIDTTAQKADLETMFYENT